MTIGRHSQAATLRFVNQVATPDRQARQRTAPVPSRRHVDPELVDIVTACRVAPEHQQRTFALRLDSSDRGSMPGPARRARQASS
jgi:hypothetical protein